MKDKINILNLYGGVGGNRKNWTNCNVVCVENDPQIAAVYRDIFPDDTVFVCDAHQFLLNNLDGFDFIWSSPPCVSHSRAKRLNIATKQSNPIYPDMKLYEEILFLKYFARCSYVVENVRPYYKCLIEPSFIIGRHFFWSNKLLLSINAEADNIKDDKKINKHGFDLSGYKGIDKRKLYRNCTSPKTAGYILSKIFGDEYVA
ncbi:MAG: DNA cytosine methyltransferase [Endomicrobium sp.]|jgi:DNA (cytosine-5)-methyltransferase 1|nr:DNA cytosine methyltransferase [Endomicrobium sp.]